jgi:uncharacterized protein YbaR (Trm112 family)
MEKISCPVCKNDLDLKVSKQQNDEIEEGTLFCKVCDVKYPITNGIANLLPPEYS